MCFHDTIIDLLAASSFSFHRQLVLNHNCVRKNQKLIRWRPRLLGRSAVREKQRGGRSGLPFAPPTPPSETPSAAPGTEVPDNVFIIKHSFQDLPTAVLFQNFFFFGSNDEPWELGGFTRSPWEPDFHPVLGAGLARGLLAVDPRSRTCSNSLKGAGELQPRPAQICTCNSRPAR